MVASVVEVANFIAETATALIGGRLVIEVEIAEALLQDQILLQLHAFILKHSPGILLNGVDFLLIQIHLLPLLQNSRLLLS